jgi:hypothetical protein
VKKVEGGGSGEIRPVMKSYSHATALHPAVCSASLETVTVLVEAGARLNAKDTAWNGTPAEH